MYIVLWIGQRWFSKRFESCLNSWQPRFNHETRQTHEMGRNRLMHTPTCIPIFPSPNRLFRVSWLNRRPLERSRFSRDCQHSTNAKFDCVGRDPGNERNTRKRSREAGGGRPEGELGARFDGFGLLSCVLCVSRFQVSGESQESPPWEGGRACRVRPSTQACAPGDGCCPLRACIAFGGWRSIRSW